MTDAREPDKSLSGTTARGFLWTTGQALVVRFVSLLGFLVMARLLSVHDYGLAALATVFTTFFQVVALGGFGRAVAGLPSLERIDLDTLFWCSVAIGTALTVILAATAGLLASAFDEPDLKPILEVLSLNGVLVAVGGISQGLLQRRLAFRSLAQVQVLSNVIATAVGIAFAIAGFGVWSLVIQTSLLAIINMIGYLILSGYRPRREFERSRVRPILAYSGNLFGESTTDFVNTRTDDFLIGSVLGSVALGIYTVAYRLLIVMMDVLSWSIGTVVFPVFGRLRHQKERLRLAYHSAARMTAVVTLPCFFFVFAAAPEITHVLFGDKWDASVPIMRILCFFGAQHALWQFNTVLLQSIGRARIAFHFAIAGAVLQVIGFAIGVQFSLEGVAAALPICALLIAPGPLVVACRSIGASPLRHLAGLLPGVLSTTVMTALLFATKEAIGGALPDLVLLVLLGIVALASYPLVLRVVGPGAFDELVGYLRGAGADRFPLGRLRSPRPARSTAS